MKAIVKEQIGQSLFYMQSLQGRRMSPLIRLARLAAEDEDTELGRLVTQMAIECLNADHNVVVLAAPFVEVAICKACAADMISRFRNIFGPWMTGADQNRVDFILHEITTTIDEHGGGEDCSAHTVLGGIREIYRQDFIVEDDEDGEDI